MTYVDVGESDRPAPPAELMLRREVMSLNYNDPELLREFELFAATVFQPGRRQDNSRHESGRWAPTVSETDAGKKVPQIFPQYLSVVHDFVMETYFLLVAEFAEARGGS